MLKIYKIFPYWLTCTDDMDANSSGCANGPWVRIRPAYRDDEGLLQHELTYVCQWWRTLGLHSLLYLCSKKYRLKAEVEAYREQIKWMRLRSDRPSSYYKDLYATWLSSRRLMSRLPRQRIRMERRRGCPQDFLLVQLRGLTRAVGGSIALLRRLLQRLL